MKKLKKLKKIQEMIDEYHNELKNEMDKLKKEHQKLVLEANSKLLSEIAKGEGLDEITLIEKYLKKAKIKPSKEIIEDSSEQSENILNHISFKGQDYFYEDKMDGNVYDSNNKKVGQWKCGSIKMLNA